MHSHRILFVPYTFTYDGMTLYMYTSMSDPDVIMLYYQAGHSIEDSLDCTHLNISSESYIFPPNRTTRCMMRLHHISAHVL